MIRIQPWYLQNNRLVLHSEIDLPVVRRMGALHQYWHQLQRNGFQCHLLLVHEETRQATPPAAPADLAEPEEPAEPGKQAGMAGLAEPEEPAGSTASTGSTGSAGSADGNGSIADQGKWSCLAVILLRPEPETVGVVRLTILTAPHLSAGEWLVKMLAWVYNEQPAYRLDFILRPGQFGWQPLLIEQGWRSGGEWTGYWYQAGSDTYRSGRLLTMLAPERPDQAVVFLPFAKAVLAIQGTATTISRIHFLRFGQKTGITLVQQTADYLRLLDEQGRLLPVRQWPADSSGRSWRARPNTLPVLALAAEQLQAYMQRQRTTFDLPLDYSAGSPFQQKVWQALQQIPYASTWNYEQLAASVAHDGQSPRQLARAVGAACAANPLPVLLPCHRVIGKNGHLVGFLGGIDIKEYLLAHEMLGI